MYLDEYLEDDLLIICPEKIKFRILDQYSDKIVSFKFMTKQEFKNHYFFSYSDEAVLYLMEKYHYHIDVAKTYLENLYVINLDKEYKNKKLLLLQNLKKELISKNLLTFDLLFPSYLKTKKVLVIGYSILDKYEEEMFLNATILNDEIKPLNTKVVSCNTIEDEVLFVIEEILKLVDQKVELNRIYLANVTDDYLYSVKKLFSYFHLPIHLEMKESIYGTKIVKDYLENKKIPAFQTEISSKLIEVVNSLVEFEDSPYYEQIFIDKLKNTYTEVASLTQEIQTISLDEDRLTDSDYLFVLGLNQDSIPKIYKNEDFIPDQMKDEVDLYPTRKKNKMSRENVLRILSNTKNLYLSYKEKSNFNQYLPSSLIQELNLEVVSYDSNKIYPSHLYNQLKLGQILDLYDKYGEENPLLPKLISSYSIDYQKYNNQFSGISDSHLKTYLKNSLKLSYTSFNTYHLCAFKYYIRYILKLDPFCDTFSILIGNIFHDMLSVMYEDNFNFDREWEYYIKKYEVSSKEKFFLSILKEELKEEMMMIKDKEMLSSYKNVLTEKEMMIQLSKQSHIFFTGKIDKIMYQKRGEDTYFAVVDYKTGTFNSNITAMKYGLSMQLPIYLYLLSYDKLFTSPIFTGMYFQKVLYPNLKWEKDKELKEMKRNNLKLQGYSTDQTDRLSSFDRSYESSELVRGLKINKDGSFSKNSKILSDQEIYLMLKYTEKLIKDCADDILKSHFEVNPKVLEKESACKNCKFKDLCFVNTKDYVYLEKEENLDFLEEVMDFG